MIEGLDEIDWVGIGTHVYGENETIPLRIRQLISDDQHVREAAADFLFGGGQDTGSIYTSTGYIIPFALQVVAEDPPITKHLFLLRQLAAVAGGGVYLSGSDKMSVSEQRAVLRVYDAIERGERLYFDLMKNPEIEVRLSVTELIASRSESAARLIPLLTDYFAGESDAEVQARIVWAIGALLTSGNFTYGNLRKQYASFFQQVVDLDRAATVRHAAGEWAVRSAISSYWNERLKDGEVSASVINTLVEWFKDNDAAKYFERDIIELLARAGAVEALIGLMNDPQTSVDLVHEIALALLHRALHGRYLQFGLPLLRFMPLQDWKNAGRYFALDLAIHPNGFIGPEVRMNLQAIVNCDRFWTVPTNMFSFFFGLPDSREELRALLAKS